MKNIGIFPGTFDPFTKGHNDIVKKAVNLFDIFYIAIGVNSNKTRLFSTDDSVEMIKSVFKGNEKIKVINYQGLTIDLCKRLRASFLVRGIRSIQDFEIERSIAEMNKNLYPKIATIYFSASHQNLYINSTIVRELIKNKTDITKFVPNEIFEFIKKIHY